MKYFVPAALLLTLSTPVIAANDHYQNGDLISVHWDSSYDYDDLQAMPATREIFDDYTNLNYIVINGAKSHQHSGIVNGSSDVMRMVFPDGLDAFNDKSNSLYAAADRWQATLQSGGTVHIAEGGPSDFTADVVRELRSRNVGNLKNIHIVQHSQWNEGKTKSTNLSLLRNVTTYRKIEDGNNKNSTAWLRTDKNRSSLFKDLTASSDYSHVWSSAFQAVTNPDRVVDFSDAVEVLEILDISTSRVSDAFDFGRVFFGGGSSYEPGNPAPASPTEPSVPSTPTTTPSGNGIAVFGSSLSDAKARYARATSLPRVDCDPANGGYICASFNNPTMSDVQSPLQPTEPSAPVVPSVPAANSDRVAVYGSNLSAAVSAYASATDLRRVDCDPASGGYICASFNNPTMSDIQSPLQPAESSAPVVPSVPVVSSGRVAVYGNNLSTARSSYASATHLRRVDCDPWNGGYICASFANPVAADLNTQSPPSQPTGSTGTTGTTEPMTGNVLHVEVENYPLGTGWIKDTARSGYSGSGYIRWSGPNLYNISQAGEGVMSFSMKPDSSGTYSLRLRSRAINPPASDLNNDVWVRLNGSGWTKIFNAGRDQWIVGGKADVNHRRYVFQQDLTGGTTYNLEISGRSNGFAIDYIELVKN